MVASKSENDLIERIKHVSSMVDVDPSLWKVLEIESVTKVKYELLKFLHWDHHYHWQLFKKTPGFIHTTPRSRVQDYCAIQF